jgi:hypothetical protein
MLENRIVKVPRQKCMPVEDVPEGRGGGRIVRIGPTVAGNVEGFAIG